jgi:hypothetical protein
VNADGFDLGLTELRKELHDLASATGNADGEPLEGYGEAADGMVRVTAVEGRLSTVDLNPGSCGWPRRSSRRRSPKRPTRH